MELYHFIDNDTPPKRDRCAKGKCKVLLFDVCKLKDDGYLDANVDDRKVRVAALEVQNTIIERILGSCFYEKLKHMVCDDSIYHRENEKYRVLLSDWLFNVARWGVLYELMMPMSFQARNTGIVTVLADNTNNASMNDIERLQKKYSEKLNDYIHRAQRFLLCNECYKDDMCCCECKYAREASLSQSTVSLGISLTKNDSPTQLYKKRRAGQL